MAYRRVIHLLSRTRDRIQKRFQRRIDELALGGIAPAHGSVLYVLQQGPLAMQDLARAIERENSTATVLVDKLEKIGYIRRSVSPEDTRSNVVSLTAKGSRIVPKVMAASQQTVEQIFAGFSETDRGIFMQLLQRVYDNMG